MLKLTPQNTTIKTVIAHTNIEASNDVKRAITNITANTDTIITAKKRADANVVATVSKPTKKRVDAKIVATTNEMAAANANKPAKNVRRAHDKVMATANANIMAATNKATNNARKVHTNTMAGNNSSNARRACINKAVIIDESNAKSAY